MSPYHNNQLNIMGLNSDEDVQPRSNTQKGHPRTPRVADIAKAPKDQSVRSAPSRYTPQKGSTEKRKRGSRVSTLATDEAAVAESNTGNVDEIYTSGQGNATTYGASDRETFHKPGFQYAGFDWTMETPFGVVKDTTADYVAGDSYGLDMPSTVADDIWSSDSAIAGMGLTNLHADYSSPGNDFGLHSGLMMGFGTSQDSSEFSSFDHSWPATNPGFQTSDSGLSTFLIADKAGDPKEPIDQPVNSVATSAEVSIKDEAAEHDNHTSPPFQDESEYEESQDEETRPSKKPKLNKDGAPRKPRQPRTKLLRWDDNDWKNVALGIVWACGENGIQIPFHQASQIVSESCTAGALQQAILKLRGKQIADGHQIPALKMAWTRKNKNGSPATNADAKIMQDTPATKNSTPKKKPTRMLSSQVLIITVKRAYRDIDRAHLAVPHTAKAAIEYSEIIIPNAITTAAGMAASAFASSPFMNNQGFIEQTNPTHSRHRRNTASINSAADFENVNRAGNFFHGPPLASPARSLHRPHPISPFGLEKGTGIDEDMTATFSDIGYAQGSELQATHKDMLSHSMSALVFPPNTPPNSDAAHRELIATLASGTAMPQGNGNFGFFQGEMTIGREEYDMGNEGDYKNGSMYNVNPFSYD